MINSSSSLAVGNPPPTAWWVVALAPLIIAKSSVAYSQGGLCLLDNMSSNHSQLISLFDCILFTSGLLMTFVKSYEHSSLKFVVGTETWLRS